MTTIQKYQYFVASLCSLSPSVSGVKLTACYFPTNRASHQVPLFSGGVTSGVTRALRHVSLSVTLSVLSPGEGLAPCPCAKRPSQDPVLLLGQSPLRPMGPQCTRFCVQNRTERRTGADAILIDHSRRMYV